MSRKPMRVMQSPLSGSVYAFNAYQIDGNAITATGKRHDVTEDVQRIFQHENARVLSLIAGIREVCGDSDGHMQNELVEHIRKLTQDAARYRWLRDRRDRLGDVSGGTVVMWRFDDSHEVMSGDALDAAIDAAMQADSGDKS